MSGTKSTTRASQRSAASQSGIGNLPLVTCRTCRRLSHIANAPDYTRAHWQKEMTIAAPGCVGPLYGLDAGHYCTLHRPTGHEAIPGPVERRSA